VSKVGDGSSKRSAAIAAEQERVRRKVNELKSPAEKIEYLLREFHTQKRMDSTGGIHTVNKPGAARGMNKRNIARILRTGKKRREMANADPSVNVEALPSNSKIRRATEATHKQSLQYIEALFANAGRNHDELKKVPSARRYAYMDKPWKGRAGRAARSKNKNTLRARARQLHSKGITQLEIAKKLDRSERMVRYYLKD
jgi:hypothetical protein